MQENYKIPSEFCPNKSINVKLVSENVSIIRHDYGLEKRFVIHQLQIPIRFCIDRYGTCLYFHIVLG